MKIETKRIVERIEKLGSISDENHCLSRFYGTRAHKKAGELLIQWMENAGMEVSKDSIGNIRGILRSPIKEAKHFVIGSHYDTVFKAGKYDGPLGILLGVEVAQRISESTIELPFHLNIVAFADEEGSRFNTAYLGSSSLVGEFDRKWLNRKDDDGYTLKEVVEKNKGDVDRIFNEYIPKEDLIGYFEAHIEQGPVLCEEDLPLCLVSGIASQTRVNIEWDGECGHAGTYPMNMRKDALTASAEFVLEVEKIGLEYKSNLVATIGKMKVKPNVSNVIPGVVNHSLDIRSIDEFFLKSIVKKLKRTAALIAERRGVKFNWEIMQSNTSVICDIDLKSILSKSILNTGTQKLIEISSGAGHDAVMLSRVTPVSMLFIRCKEGISHNPLEYCESKDISEALKVCNGFLDELIKLYK